MNTKKSSRRIKQAKKVANALSMFKTAKKQLEDVNADINGNITDNEGEINSLEMENKELGAMQTENSRIIENLAQFVVNE